MRYAALVDGRAERIYGDDLEAVVIGEWNHRRLLRGRETIEVGRLERIGRSRYLIVEESDDQIMGDLDAMVTCVDVFGHEHDDTLTLLSRPIPFRLPDSILSIQRYRGKTNEAFTRLMVSLGIAGLDGIGFETVVFDPVAGRGTTLNAAVHLGISATGIEIDDENVHQYGAFVSRWLRDERLKHKFSNAHVRDSTGSRRRSIEFTYATSRDDHKAGRTASVRMIAGDSTDARRWCRRAGFDVLVADLPYGIQHGSHHGANHITAPALIESGMQAWIPLMRPGATICLAWNLRTLQRDDLLGILDAAGLEIVGGGAPSTFEHRVDHSIQRDLVVARIGDHRHR